MAFNFSKLKIVKFKNGNYAVRRGIFRYEYLYLYNLDKAEVCWVEKSNRDAFKQFALTTNLQIAIRARDQFLKKEDHKKDNGRVLTEDELFFTDLQNKQETFGAGQDTAYVANNKFIPPSTPF